jgi:hypothetical protein
MDARANMRLIATRTDKILLVILLPPKNFLYYAAFPQRSEGFERLKST